MGEKTAACVEKETINPEGGYHCSSSRTGFRANVV